jgi:hypothetical protein
MDNIDSIDRFTNDRPGCYTVSRKEPRLDSENPIEFIVIHNLREVGTKEKPIPVDIHYHFEDKGDELHLIETYELVGDGDGGCKKKPMEAVVQHPQVKRELNRLIGNRYKRIYNGNGEIILQVQTNYEMD